MNKKILFLKQIYGNLSFLISKRNFEFVNYEELKNIFRLNLVHVYRTGVRSGTLSLFEKK